MKKHKFLSCLLAFCLCFAIAIPALAAEISNKQQLLETMNQYIDESIVGDEREVMQEILLNVEPENRENVVYIDENDNIYATNPDLKERITVEYPEPSLLFDINNEDIMPLDTGNGAYRRISTVPGFSWMSGYVYLPAIGNNFYVANKDLETPHLYIGGSAGAEVDAGMLFNTYKEDWSLFISVDRHPVAYTTRYMAGQQVFLKYYVTSDNNVVIQATGYDVNGDKNTYIKRAKAEGWRVDGTNCCLKRVTTISQNGQNLHSGSYMKNISWSNWKIGTSSTKNADWSTKDTQVNVVYPSAVYAKYSMTNHANDTVSILYNN